MNQDKKLSHLTPRSALISTNKGLVQVNNNGRKKNSDFAQSLHGSGRIVKFIY